MFHWVKYPFVRLLTAFLVGIAIGLSHKEPADLRLILGAAVLLYVALVVIWTVRNLDFARPLVGFLSLLVIGILGFGRVLSFPEINRKSHFHHHLGSIRAYEGIVTEPPEHSNQGFSSVIKITRVWVDGGWISASGRVLCYLTHESLAEVLGYGTVIIGVSKLVPVEPPKNPGQFDFRRYLAAKSVFHTTRSDWGNMAIRVKESGLWVLKASHRLRLYFQDIISANLHDPVNRGVAHAILLGKRNDIDLNLRSAYQNSGATHVLAVSGLHVGILFLVISFIFKTIGQKQSWISVLVNLVVLMSYALVTGASPSVLRAVSMFSILIIGHKLDRSKSIYNNLSFSAFGLLMINPHMLEQIGFQLSYLAVLGIVYYQPKISGLWEPRSPFLSKVWSLNCLTVSAQILTFPLVIYYFHQFPTLFMISNLLVVPLVSVILCLGLLLISLAWIPILPVFIGSLLDWGLEIMNFFVSQIGGQGFSTISHLNLTKVETLLIFLIIGSFTLFLSFKRFQWLLISTILLSIFCMTRIHHLDQWGKQQKVIFYSTREPFCHILFSRKYNLFNFAETGLENNVPHFITENASIHNGGKFDPRLNEELALERSQNWVLMVFQGRTFMLPKNAGIGINLEGFEIDYLMLLNSNQLNYENLTGSIRYKNLIMRTGTTVSVDLVSVEGERYDHIVHDLSKSALEISIK